MEPITAAINIVPADSPPRHQNLQSNNSTILHLQAFVRHLQDENTHLRNLLEQTELDHEAAVRELETRTCALSQTLKETRASKKKLGMQKEYFMGLCNTWGEYMQRSSGTLSWDWLARPSGKRTPALQGPQ